MSRTKDFLKWVSDPARTDDDLFSVELLIEIMRHRRDWPFPDRKVSFEEQLEVLKARGSDPAYRPCLDREEVEELARQIPQVTQFSCNGMSDRAPTNLTALSFFPELTTVNLTAPHISDLSPLAPLQKLAWLTIIDGNHPGHAQPLDLGRCGEMPELERLSLSLRHPWPALSAIGRWPIRELRLLTINILALDEVTEFPNAELVEINDWPNTDCGLRDLRRFTAMPKVKRLRLYRTASLEGIERYPTLLNLTIGGAFSDLEPLTRLPKLTALTLSGEHFTDLTPLTRMLRLRELHLMRERPIDLGLLIDVPELRRVRFSQCAIMRTEVAALNAGLPPETADFETPEPRPLGPLKFYRLSNENKAGIEFFAARDKNASEVREKAYDGDAAMMQSEGRSFREALHRKLNKLLGRRWGIVTVHEGLNNAGDLSLAFKRYQDTVRIREILQFLREESARCRYPWVFRINVEPHGDMSYELEQLRELEEQKNEQEEYWLAKYYRPETALKEDAEQLQRHEERYKYLEAEHRLQLQKEQGMTITPPSAPSVDPGSPSSDDEDEEEEEDLAEEELLSAPSSDDDDDQGGVAIAPPPPAPPGTDSLGEELQYYLRLYEDCVVVSGQTWPEQARYGLGEAPVEWHPEQSPPPNE
jgi:hypothetical protein